MEICKPRFYPDMDFSLKLFQRSNSSLSPLSIQLSLENGEIGENIQPIGSFYQKSTSVPPRVSVAWESYRRAVKNDNNLRLKFKAFSPTQAAVRE